MFDSLPEHVWRQEHLPGARSMPLATFEPSRVEDVKRDEPLLVVTGDSMSDGAVRLGWWLSSEEHDPRQLVAAALAESSGLERR